MKISVVTVSFNSEKTIGYTLESFFRQDHPDKELVIIDGASTDKTLEIIHSFTQENLIIASAPDRGIYDAMNKGFVRYTGDAVGFLNADDCFDCSQVLSQISDALHSAEMVFGNVIFVQDHIARRVVRRWRGSPYTKGAFRRGWMPAHPSLYVRRSVVDAVGGFDLSYGTAADYEWMIRAFELQDFGSCFIDEEFVVMQAGGASNAGLMAWIRGNIRCLRARRLHLDVGYLDLALITKPLSKAAQFLIG